MGRAISFDLDLALNGAMRQFWKGGYTATSLQELLAATGIGGGSFYNTLKSKKHLFLECLRRYGAVEVRARLEALSAAPTVALGLRAMYRLSLDALDDPDTPSRLCMMSAMLSQDVLADPDFRQVVEHGQAEFESRLAGLIRRDIEEGHLPVTTDADTVAAVVATYGHGINRMALVSFDRPRFERQMELFLDGLGLRADPAATLVGQRA